MGRDLTHRDKSQARYSARYGGSSLTFLPEVFSGAPPLIELESRRATLTGWSPTVGAQLEYVDDGASVILDRETPLLDPRDRAIVASGDYYACATVGQVQLGSADSVIRLVLRMPTAAGGDCVLSIHDGANGIKIATSTSKLVATLDGAGGSASVESAAITYSTWIMADLVIDAGGSALWHICGEYSGAAVDVSGVGSLTSTDPLRICSDGASARWPSALAYVAIFAPTLSSHQNLSDHREAFYRMCGVWPQVSRGAKEPSFTRASPAYITRYGYGQVEQHYRVHNGWPRVCERRYPLASGGDGADENGFGWSEEIEKNAVFIQQSCVWTSVDHDHAISGSWGAIVGDATSDYHFVGVDLHPTNPIGHWFSAHVKPTIHPYFAIASFDINAAYAVAIFDSVDGSVVATEGPVLDTFSEPIDEEPGAFRVGVRYSGGIDQHTHLIFAHDATSITPGSYIGDGVTVDLYVHGIQHDYGTRVDGLDRPSRYIRTDGRSRRLASPVSGLLSESESTNVQDHTEDMSVSYWGGGASFSAGPYESPYDSVLSDAIREDSTNGVHFYTWGSFNFTIGNEYSLFFSFRPLRRKIFSVRPSNPAVRIGVIVDTVAGTPTVTPFYLGQPNPEIAEIGGGWFSVWQRGVVATATAGTVVEFDLADDLGSFSFQGEDTDSLAVIGPCVILGKPDGRSYIRTTGAEVTRDGDVMIAIGGASAGGGSKAGSIISIVDTVRMSCGATRTIASVYDSSDADPNESNVRLDIATGTDFARLSATELGAAVFSHDGDATMIDDEHAIRASWSVGRSSIIVDGDDQGADQNPADIPGGLDRIGIGCRGDTGTDQLDGMVCGLEVRDR